MDTVGYHEPRDDRGRALRIPEEDRRFFDLEEIPDIDADDGVAWDIL
jgi:hypothetical protein